MNIRIFDPYLDAAVIEAAGAKLVQRVGHLQALEHVSIEKQGQCQAVVVLGNE